MTAKRTSPSVAVLGAGIMGCSVALYLARKKIPVVLIDAACEPFTGASRWNEGKIHLGYLYGADVSLATAKKLIPGGLNFPDLVSDLTGQKLDDGIVTQTDDRYLIHRNSVVNSSNYWALAKKVSALVKEHPDADKYFVPLNRHVPRVLTDQEIAAEYDAKLIEAAIEVPERSVKTNHVADCFVEAVGGEPLIHSKYESRVTAVVPCDGVAGNWQVKVQDKAGNEESLGQFSVVVNALWEGRRAIDATAGLQPIDSWTNRFRLSLFAKLKNQSSLRSAVIAVGPFGDVKNYNGTDLYLSWYNAGLLMESHSLAPPEVDLPNPGQERQIIQTKLSNLARIIPGIESLADDIAESQLKGGWVYAAGTGRLSDANSLLHRRNRVGAFSKQGYFSVDTGKYSIAPWLAQELADNIEALVR